MSVCLSVCWMSVRELHFFGKCYRHAVFCKSSVHLWSMLLSIKNFGSGHFTGRKLAGTGPNWSKNEKNDLKWARNGQKWAFLTCNLLQMVGPDGGHIFEKKKLAPPFLGPGPGPFFREKTAKND